MLGKLQDSYRKRHKQIEMALVIFCALGFVIYSIKGITDITINVVTSLWFPSYFSYALQRMTYHYGLLFMIPLLFYSSRNWKIFKWQIWLAICSGTIIFASTCCVVGGLNYMPYLPNFAWSNISVISWAVLFALMMFLLQNKGKIQNYDSFVTAFASVVLGSWIYEAFYPGNLGFIYLLNNPVAIVSFAVLALMAFRYHVKFSWILPVSFYFLFFVQLPRTYDFDFSLAKYVFFYSTVFWITRFTVFPFFVSYALSFKGEKHD